MVANSPGQQRRRPKQARIANQIAMGPTLRRPIIPKDDLFFHIKWNIVHLLLCCYTLSFECFLALSSHTMKFKKNSVGHRGVVAYICCNMSESRLYMYTLYMHQAHAQRETKLNPNVQYIYHWSSPGANYNRDRGSMPNLAAIEALKYSVDCLILQVIK
jgi:hypothetical protein